MTTRPARLLLLLVALLSSGCATFAQRAADVESLLAAGQIDEALKRLEPKGDGDEALVLLNRALLLRMRGDYAASNAALLRAKQLMDTLATVSVHEQAGALTVNDTLRAYAGSPFERVLVHFYLALNYLQLGRPDDARVEALQVDLRLQQQGEDSDDPPPGEVAVVRYLNGLIFEQLGEWSDAMIAYRKAYQAYLRAGVAPPPSLGQALLRLADYLGLSDERRRYQQAFGMDHWEPLASFRRRGEVIVFVATGLAPRKREEAIQTLDPTSGIMVRIALPSLVPRAQPVAEVKVTVDGEARPAVLAADLERLAQQALAAELPAITARAIARAVVKYRAAKEVDRHNDGLGLLVNIAGMISERADTRSWFTLPQRLYLQRRALAPGRHAVTVAVYGHAGRLLAEKHFSDVTLQAGDKVYLSWHWIPPIGVLRTVAAGASTHQGR